MSMLYQIVRWAIDQGHRKELEDEMRRIKVPFRLEVLRICNIKYSSNISCSIPPVIYVGIMYCVQEHYFMLNLTQKYQVLHRIIIWFQEHHFEMDMPSCSWFAENLWEPPNRQRLRPSYWQKEKSTTELNCCRTTVLLWKTQAAHNWQKGKNCHTYVNYQRKAKMLEHKNFKLQNMQFSPSVP